MFVGCVFSLRSSFGLDPWLVGRSMFGGFESMNSRLKVGTARGLQLVYLATPLYYFLFSQVLIIRCLTLTLQSLSLLGLVPSFVAVPSVFAYYLFSSFIHLSYVQVVRIRFTVTCQYFYLPSSSNRPSSLILCFPFSLQGRFRFPSFLFLSLLVPVSSIIVQSSNVRSMQSAV